MREVSDDVDEAQNHCRMVIRYVNVIYASTSPYILHLMTLIAEYSMQHLPQALPSFWLIKV